MTSAAMESDAKKSEDAKIDFKGALIDGKWSDDKGLECLNVVAPATGAAIGSISKCGGDQALKALEAAKKAGSTWGQLSIDERAKHIDAFKQKLIEKKPEILKWDILETGKVKGNAEYDFNMLIDCLSYHVEEVRRCYGTVIPSPDSTSLSYTKHTPVGVVVAVLTWNFPLLNLGYKLGPILASGCTCVIKPSEETPLSTSYALSLLSEVGFPNGVVNVVNGTGIDLLKPLCESTIPRLLTTIGSVAMGRRIVQYSPTSIKRFSLELGGDAPVLVFADCDLDAAVGDIVGLKFANGGQICVSPNRVYVQKEVYEKFVEKAVAIARKYDFGSGEDHDNKAEVLQPVISEASLTRMLSLVDDAKQKGGRVVCGGKRVDRPGFFLEPTIVADANDEMAMQKDEIFGPILPVRSFSTADEAFTLANQSEVGLSSYVYTKDLDIMLRAENELMTGNVLINGVHYSIELPHGGLKNSGSGKDISHLSLRDYYDIRRITVKRKAPV